MQIIPIASGKGGVGKSLFAANLAIALGQAEKKVVLADLDLGASNLHLVLGVQGKKDGIGTFLTKSSEFKDIIIDTEYENLRFIPGDSEIPGFAALKIYQRNALVKELLKLETDYLILDLGAGTHLGILDFFLMSPNGIIITSPSVTATLDAYVFLKNSVFRMMCASFPVKSKGGLFLENLKTDAKSMQRLYIPSLTEEVNKIDPKNTEKFLKKFTRFKPRIVMNMIDDPKDAEKALKIRRSAKQYLNIDIEHLGIIYNDSIQDTALSSRLPVLVYKPQAMISQAIYRIAEKILQAEGDNYTEEEFEEFANYSFLSAEAEAETDFKSKMSYLDELIGGEVLSAGEMSEIIKSQQFEITALKNENLLLKSKILKAAKAGFIV
ncbi:P-loop NTPase [Treponema pedis]|uniref:Flagellar synthesis regulator FleN n=2 Tax=Treponema pedis TaxID=409322 RepID=S5ZJD3_9SPIR|nr:P-loop NTPase [Treponema pedis]AGT42642.1 flagellar synthesis regulator FleN [Treponema pedis str. T A4]QOW61660.1 P-loop NTPase [Treponema pedis]QSI03534.1 MinD/ParA family protein [Treponema pedis]